MTAKVIRKTQAGNADRRGGKDLGVIAAAGEIRATRREMAETVWAYMKESDSRECRFCHDRNAMDPEKQGKMAQRQHAKALTEGKTCIDCHQGIARNFTRNVRNPLQNPLARQRLRPHRRRKPR